MHRGTYPNSTHAQAPPPEQDSSSSGSREVNNLNAVNDVPHSGLDFQGGQYAGNFFQQGPQFFTNPHALVSQIQSAFPHQLAIPVLPGNHSQVYGGTQSRETAPNNVTGTNFWEGSQPPIPYEQPKQVNYYNKKIGETGVSVAGNSPTAFPPPPPGVRSTPNEQGIFDYVWKLDDVDIQNESGGDLRVIIRLKKVQSQAA